MPQENSSVNGTKTWMVIIRIFTVCMMPIVIWATSTLHSVSIALPAIQSDLEKVTAKQALLDNDVDRHKLLTTHPSQEIINDGIDENIEEIKDRLRIINMKLDRLLSR